MSISITLIKHELNRRIPFQLKTNGDVFLIQNTDDISFPPGPHSESTVVTVYKNKSPSQVALASFKEIVSSEQETDYSQMSPKDAVLDALQRLGQATMPDLREYIRMNGGFKGRSKSIPPTLSDLKKTRRVVDAGRSNGLILFRPNNNLH